ncbi:MAG: alanyl-tRNA editing protein [Oscillospiraceae bacterium]|nr:alanyl-tRNA editing protein [Oscillospiraceae bacterium]
METVKLFYEDCHCREFSATVTGCQETPKGYAVTLSATAFYPEGGGQFCDIGTLGDAAVTDVREEKGQLFHYCDRPLALGSTVRGSIDWQRRFDLMQQHTGEHIVSGILHQMFGYHNVGFHVGKDVMEVDFDGPVSPEALAQVEEKANRAVWENLQVRCWYPGEAELPNVGYRTKRPLPWPVRIVEVPGYDKCACCGVHVAYTGEVGMIKILSCVKFHQGVRMEMVCGGRALSYLNRIYEQNRLVSQTFSAKPLETGDAARRISEALASEKLRCAALERELFDRIAASYASQPYALRFEDGMAPGSVRLLAERISQHVPLAAVFSQTEGGFDVCLAGQPEQVRTLGAAMAKALSGRGGGKPGFFQGRVQAKKEEICQFFGEQLGIF